MIHNITVVISALFIAGVIAGIVPQACAAPVDPHVKELLAHYRDAFKTGQTNVSAFCRAQRTTTDPATKEALTQLITEQHITCQGGK